MKWKLMSEEKEGAEGSAAPVVQEVEEPEGDSKIWDDLLDEGSEVEEPEAEVAEEVGGEAEPKAAEVVVAPATPEPKVETQEVVAPVVAPAPATAEVVSPEPAPAQEPTITEEARKAMRQQALASLAEQYRLSEDDATALQVEPEKVLPKLAANLHAAIYEAVLQRVVAETPALVSRSLEMRAQTQQAEEAFYARWGDLRPHGQEVQKVAAMWRQMYPSATLEQAIEGIGSSAMALLGKTQGQAPQAQAAPSSPPPPPAGPSARAAMAAPRSRLSTEEQSFVDLAKTFEEEF
jgi:hypothetical protein